MTAGYLTQDLVLCVRHRETLGDAFTLVHHCVAIAAFLLGVRYGFGTFYMSTMLLSEASTPFVNMQRMLLLSKRSEGTLYLVNGVTMASVFFVFRVLLNSAFLAHIVWAWVSLCAEAWPRHTRAEIATVIALTLLFVAHSLVNLYWWRKIWRHAVRRIDAMYGAGTDPPPPQAAPLSSSASSGPAGVGMPPPATAPSTRRREQRGRAGAGPNSKRHR